MPFQGTRVPAAVLAASDFSRSSAHQPIPADGGLGSTAMPSLRDQAVHWHRTADALASMAAEEADPARANSAQQQADSARRLAMAMTHEHVAHVLDNADSAQVAEQRHPPATAQRTPSVEVRQRPSVSALVDGREAAELELAL